jgi:hypothetical protein
MIPRIFKSGSSARLVSYLLRPNKEAQIVDTSLFTPEINRLIAYETVITNPAIRETASEQLNQAFTRINDLNHRLKNKMMHLVIGFDPEDGELSPEFKGEIARSVIESMGFANTYWVAISHGRDDPEHDHIHDHDHMHILAARVDIQGKTISDSWDFPKAKRILRGIERHYDMQPFIPFWERDHDEPQMYKTPEIHWMLEPYEEEEDLQQKPKRGQSM